MSVKKIDPGAFIRTPYVFKHLSGAHHVINAPCRSKNILKFKKKSSISKLISAIIVSILDFTKDV